MTGTVYLLHFSRPYHHAGHYIGYTDGPLADRLELHREGQGARLMAVIAGEGISFDLARTWPGGRKRERQLKRMGGASRRCPMCGISPRADRRPA